MRITTIWLVFVCWGAAALWQVGAVAAAQPADETQADAAGADDDSEAKNAIFNSDEWRRTRMSFEDWLSIQNFYTAEQVEDIKRRLRKQIATLSANDLKSFMERMQAKLEILMGPEASDLRSWLGHFVSPTVILTPQEMERFDIVTMTAPQLEAALRTIESRRASRRAAGSAFQGAREQKVAATVESNRARRQASQQVRASAQSQRTTRVTQQAHLAPPRRPPPPPRPRPQIILGGAGGVGVALPIP